MKDKDFERYFPHRSLPFYNLRARRSTDISPSPALSAFSRVILKPFLRLSPSLWPPKHSRRRSRHRRPHPDPGCPACGGANACPSISSTHSCGNHRITPRYHRRTQHCDQTRTRHPGRIRFPPVAGPGKARWAASRLARDQSSSLGSPIDPRILFTSEELVINAMILIALPHRGHTSGRAPLMAGSEHIVYPGEKHRPGVREGARKRLGFDPLIGVAGRFL